MKIYNVPLSYFTSRSEPLNNISFIELKISICCVSLRINVHNRCIDLKRYAENRSKRRYNIYSFHNIIPKLSDSAFYDNRIIHTLYQFGRVIDDLLN